MEKKSDYKQTLHLPTTDFPMRANLTQKEPGQLAAWEKSDLYSEILRRRQGAEKYILHDGPPYANGHIHIGHALNKILKDIIIKSKSMSGYAAPYVPGWDCHGLPIEHQVLKELGAKKQGMSKGEIRKLCREYAEKFVNIQRDEFKRLGVFGDWEHPYLTMTPGYEASIVREFGKVVGAGAVYKGKKPVLWCPFDETALAEAEVEYADQTSPSIYVKFPVASVLNPETMPAKMFFPIFGINFPDDVTSISFMIWTTTPWTLPANQAICLHPDYDYDFIKVGSETFIIASKLADRVAKMCGWTDFQKLGSKKGDHFEGLECLHPILPEKKSRVVLDKFVTLDQGTGIVHIAPGHGQEDYEVGLRYGLEVYAPVDHQGRFTKETPEWAGTRIFDANPKIIEFLKAKNLLVATEEITHSYPHCWRCKNPVIFRATEQWFISMEKNRLRERAIAAIEKDVTWIPKWGKDRILGMIQSRPDWCISRQRVWGVPIVAFTCVDCKTPLYSKEIADHVADQMENEGGSDIWFSKPADALLPKGSICKGCGGARLQQESDILDVWFESGVSHAAVLENKNERPELRWPADLYLEGSDQHRGWFHSSLLVALETHGRPPYNAVLTHGFTVDGSGKKMSKSAGNVVAPQEVINKHGAEILRLWVSATDFREDVRISPEILTQLAEAYRKIRNTCRFLIGNIGDFDSTPPAPTSDLLEIDRWALHRLHLLNEKIQRAYDASEFHQVFHALNNFCSVDLSSFYLDILKDRLYTSGAQSTDRRAAQHVLRETLSALVRLMAPVLSFTAEEIWTYLPADLKSGPSVHEATFPKTKEVDPGLEAIWERLIQIREEVARVLERARKEKKIGNALEARVALYIQDDSTPQDLAETASSFSLLQKRKEFLPALFIVSQVDLLSWSAKPKEIEESGLKGLAVQVFPARGTKCERCWTYREDVGRNEEHPTLCHRCVEAVIADRTGAQ